MPPFISRHFALPSATLMLHRFFQNSLMVLFSVVLCGLPATSWASKEATTKTDTQNKTKQLKQEGAKKMNQNPIVTMETSMGSIEIELFKDKAPVTVENFLKYIDQDFYSGTIFHRVIDGFMIQGGGFTETMDQKPTQAPIKNEATNGLKNDRGTLAMARTSIVDSATAQFFINVKDNAFLNHVNQAQFGYAVFGKVVNGMDVVDKIKGVATTNKGGHENVPTTPVVIKAVKRK